MSYPAYPTSRPVGRFIVLSDPQYAVAREPSIFHDQITYVIAHSALYGLITTPDEGINDGEEIWTKLVSLHSNVVLVICGHSYNPRFGTPFLTSTRIDGSICHQITNDYQGMAPYGGGWLVEYVLDASNRQLRNRVYSPYYKAERYDANRFNLSLPEV
jgi:hypothetical protein